MKQIRHLDLTRIYDIATRARFLNNDARKTKLDSLDGGQDGENNDAGFVEISKIIVRPIAFFLGPEPSNGLYI